LRGTITSSFKQY